MEPGKGSQRDQREPQTRSLRLHVFQQQARTKLPHTTGLCGDCSLLAAPRALISRTPQAGMAASGLPPALGFSCVTACLPRTVLEWIFTLSPPAWSSKTCPSLPRVLSAQPGAECLLNEYTSERTAYHRDGHNNSRGRKGAFTHTAHCPLKSVPILEKEHWGSWELVAHL